MAGPPPVRGTRRRASGAPPAGEPVAAPDVAARWLRALERIMARSAHEVFNALNGVAVNLEVVRLRAARAEREGTPAQGITSFVATAVEQLEAATPMVQGAIALARPARHPFEPAAAAAQLAAVLAPVARADGGALVLESAVEVGGAAAVSGELGRLVLGEALLAALERARPAAEGAPATVRCRVECATAGAPILVTLRADGGALPALDQEVETLARAGGIEVHAEPGALRLSFPAAGL